MFKCIENTAVAFTASGTFYNLPKGTFQEDIERLKKLQSRGDEHSKPLRGIIYTVDMTQIPAQFMYELDVICALDRLGTNVLATEGFRAKKLIPMDDKYAENKHNLWTQTTYNRVMQFSLQWILRFLKTVPAVNDFYTMQSFIGFLYSLPFVQLFTQELKGATMVDRDIRPYDYESFVIGTYDREVYIKGMSPAAAIDLLTYQSFYWLKCEIKPDNLMSCQFLSSNEATRRYVTQRFNHPNREMRRLAEELSKL